MREKRDRKLVSIALVIVMLLCITTQPVIAWGGLTHYSINRDAGKNSTEELSAAVAPDALHDFYYGNSGLDTFVNKELLGVLYGPLGYFLCNVSVDNESRKLWASGWMTHITADRSAHGTYLPGSPYLGDNNYISAVGADTLLKHIIAEFGADILSYWLHEGTMPTDIVIYTDQVGEAFEDYDSYCDTIYSDEYDPVRYLEAFESLLVTIWVEQVLIDIRQDERPQFTDWTFLIWAWCNYHEEYDIYYPCAVGNVTELPTCEGELITTCNPSTPCNRLLKSTREQSTDSSSALLAKRKMHQAEYVKIKMDVGKQLINEGLIIPHKEFDTKTGAVTISFEQTVSDRKLAKAYKRYFEETYEKRTGKKVKILDEITSKRKHITVRDVKKDYPELYQKLIEKGVIRENRIDRDKVYKHR